MGKKFKDLTEEEKQKKLEYNRNWYQKKKVEQGSYYKQTRQEYYQKNKESFAARSKNWYSNPDNKLRDRERKFNINLISEIEKQKGLCALGGEPLPSNLRDIHIDHDHETNVYRGLLCPAHNTGLGMFGDDWELLEVASKYVFNGKLRALNGY